MEPILQFPLHYQEKIDLTQHPVHSARAATGQCDHPAAVPSAIPNAAGTATHLRASSMPSYVAQAFVPPAYGSLGSGVGSATNRQTTSQRERFILRMRREVELLADPTNNSAHMAPMYFPHLFQPAPVVAPPSLDDKPAEKGAAPTATDQNEVALPANTTGAQVHAAAIAQPSIIFPHSPFLHDPAAWKHNSLNYDALRNQMKKIVYIQSQISAWIREQEVREVEPTTSTETAAKEQARLDELRLKSEDESARSRRDRTPRPVDPLSPSPPSCATVATNASGSSSASSIATSLASHPNFHLLQQAHATFWKLLTSEMTKFHAFAQEVVHRQRMDDVWSVMMASGVKVEGGGALAADGTAKDNASALPLPSVCACGCGTVLKTVLKFVLSEVLHSGSSSASPTLFIGGTGTSDASSVESSPAASPSVQVSVCPLAKYTVQRFICSLLHLDQYRKFTVHNYVVYQRLLDQYAHYTRNPVLEKYTAMTESLATDATTGNSTKLEADGSLKSEQVYAPPSTAPLPPLTIQQQCLRHFLATIAPFVPLQSFLQRMAQAETIAIRTFERGLTWENIGPELTFLLQQQQQANGDLGLTCALRCGASTANGMMVASTLLPCSHVFCFRCLSNQTNFGVCCPLLKCQRELTMNADMKAKVSIEEWMRAMAASMIQEANISRPSMSVGPIAPVAVGPVAATIVAVAAQPIAVADQPMPALPVPAPAVMPVAAVPLPSKQRRPSLSAAAVQPLAAAAFSMSASVLDETKISPTMSTFSEETDASAMQPGTVAPYAEPHAQQQQQLFHQQQLQQQQQASNFRTSINADFVESTSHAMSASSSCVVTPQRSRSNSYSHAMPGFDARRLSLSDSRSCSSEEEPQPAYAHRRRASSTDHPYGDPEAYYHSAEYQQRFQLQQQRARAAAARPKSASRPNSTVAKNHSRVEHASQVHQPPPTYDPHRSLEEYHRLLATHVPCEGDDRPVTDEDLASGNYILGCGGTVAAPLAYEEVAVTSAEGITSTQLKPKRGQGYSCHHCKTTKEPLLLFFCSNLVKKGKNLKKCKKKYCESCLKRLYLPEFSEGGRYWHCPSCKRSCVCAHCTRVRNGVNARPVKRKLKKGEQPGSPASMTDEPAMAHPSPDELQSMSDRIALAMRNAARQGNTGGEEDPDALAIVNAITHHSHLSYPPHQQHGGIGSHGGEIDMSEIEAQLLRQSREIEQEKQRTADLLRQARLARSLHAQQLSVMPTGMDVAPSPTSFLSASAGGSGSAAGDTNQSAPMVTSPAPAAAAPNIRARSPATINGSPMTISLVSPPPPSNSPPYHLPSLPSGLQPMATETPNAGFALSTPGGAGLSTYNLAPVRASGTSSSGLMSPLDMPMMTPSALDEMVSPSALQKSPMVNSSTQDFPNFFLPSPLPNSTQLRWAQNQHAQR